MKRAVVLFLVVATTQSFCILPSSNAGARTTIRTNEHRGALFVPRVAVPLFQNKNRGSNRHGTGTSRLAFLFSSTDLFSRGEGGGEGMTLFPGSKVQVETTDAGSLAIHIPALGLDPKSSPTEIGSATIFLGIAANLASSVVRSSSLPFEKLLFSVPFWLAGGGLARRGILQPATRVDLSIGVHAWRMERQLMQTGALRTTREGATHDLMQASIQSNMVVNGKPLTCVVLETRQRFYHFGHLLEEQEKEELVALINNWLQVNANDIQDNNMMDQDDDTFLATGDLWDDHFANTCANVSKDSIRCLQIRQ